MTSTLIRDFGEELLADRRISMKRIDDAVRRILRIKFRAGLFENPYAPFPPDEAEAQMLRPDAVAAARKAAGRSMVLLQNEGGILPLDPAQEDGRDRPAREEPARHARPVVGRRPRHRRRDRLRRDQRSRAPARPTPRAASSRTPSRRTRIRRAAAPTPDFAEAVAVAQAADQVVLALGETREMSGEAAARSTLDLPGRQEELIRAIKATGKPYVVVLFNGRPLALEDVVDDTPALLEAWFPGVQAGPAVADVVFGKVNPGGKLPVSFPRRLGQVPIYYNHERTGRPVQPGREVELAAPRHPELLAALRVRLRAQLHDVRGLEPAAELLDACRSTAASRPP